MCNSDWSDLRKVADNRRSGKFLKALVYTLRWWLFPLLFTAVCWTVVLSPAVLPAAPLVFRSRKEVGERFISKISRALPPVPDNLADAFSLGVIFEQVSRGASRALLSDAAVLVGRAADDPLTLDELERMRSHLEDLQAHRGVIARVTGAFSFVNLMWLGAIFGIAISVGPSLSTGMIFLQLLLFHLA